MWRVLGLAIVLGGLAGCSSAASTEQPVETTTVSLSVDGMMCADSCAKTVQKILAAQPGVEDVVVNFEQKQATCRIDPLAFDAEATIAELADRDFVATVK